MVEPTGIERLDSRYIEGYTDALKMVYARLEPEDLSYDMRMHKRPRTMKEFAKVVKLMIQYRHVFRDYDGIFIRCNDNAPGGYEVFDSKNREIVYRLLKQK